MAVEIEEFSETVNTVAHGVPCDPCTVRVYADSGLIECKRLASGLRLFKPSATALVQQIRAERLARRGGRREKKG